MRLAMSQALSNIKSALANPFWNPDIYPKNSKLLESWRVFRAEAMRFAEMFDDAECEVGPTVNQLRAVGLMPPG